MTHKLLWESTICNQAEQLGILAKETPTPNDIFTTSIYKLCNMALRVQHLVKLVSMPLSAYLQITDILTRSSYGPLRHIEAHGLRILHLGGTSLVRSLATRTLQSACTGYSMCSIL